MKFMLSEQTVRLASFNTRAEIHGENPKPAADLKIEAALANDVLAEFHPSLKSFLYHYDDGRQGDLVAAAQKHDKHWMPPLRIPQLGPLKWNEEITGAKVTVHYGTGSKSDIVLSTCNVNGFQIEPQEGGTVVLTMRVQAHPDEKQFGKLCTMIGTDINVSIDPPEAPAELKDAA